ncbi:AMP-binding enzyme, partial [Toxoplasma gondii ARI]
MDGPAVDNSTEPFLRFWEKTQDGLTSSVWLSREDLHLLAAQASRRLVESLGGCMQKEQGNYSVSQLAENHTEQRQQKQGKQQTRAGAATEGIEGQTTNRTGLLKPLRGVCIAHYMTKNRVEEVILRLAAKASGYIPVTINWDADGIDRILYKIESTHCQAVIVDEEVPVACLNRLAEAAQGRFKVRDAASLTLTFLILAQICICEHAFGSSTSHCRCFLRRRCVFKVMTIFLFQRSRVAKTREECKTAICELSVEENQSACPQKKREKTTFLLYVQFEHHETHIADTEKKTRLGKSGKIERTAKESWRRRNPQGNRLQRERSADQYLYISSRIIYGNAFSACTCLHIGIMLTIRHAFFSLLGCVWKVVFTSGTTGRPKGAILTNKNMETSCLALRQLLDLRDDTSLTLVIVNPLHHVNSSVMLELALRSRRAKVHLVSRYTTSFWRLLADVAEEEAAASGRPERSAVPKRDFRLLTPLVSRHIDFLRELVDTNRLTGVSVHRLAHALRPKEVVLLLGSAPVGLTTVQTFLRLLGKLPAIRFGSTETCLQ